MTNQFSKAQTNIGLPELDGLASAVDQGYENTCAVRCQELILREFGVYVPQEQLMHEAESHGWFSAETGTPMADVGKLLELHQIPVTQYEGANIFNLTSEIAQGHKVIVGVDAKELWGQTGILHDLLEFFGYETPNHALLVSGVDISNPDNVRVIITDPGTGDVAKSYPLQEFLDAWKDSNYFMVSTDEPVPMHMNSPEMTYFNYVEGHIPMVGNISYDEFEQRFSPFFGISCNDPAFSEAVSLMSKSQELGYVPESSPVDVVADDTNDSEEVDASDSEADDSQADTSDLNHPLDDNVDVFDDHFDLDDHLF